MKRHKRLIVHLQPVVNNFTTGRPLIKGNRKKLSGVWSPSRLFASGEQGAWYDPSDLSTMFQDIAGTTPVTADGQTVGLILDKSKGLVLGSELVTNGDFSDGTTGWTASGSTISVVGGKLQAVTTVGYGGVTKLVNVVAGNWYIIKADRFAGSVNPSLRVGSTGFNSVDYLMSTNTVGSGTWFVRAVNTTMYFTLIVESASVGESALFDNISVREIPGNHATAPSDAARPLYKTDGTYHWLQFDGVDDSLSTASIDFTGTDKMSVFSGFVTSDITGFDGLAQLGSTASGGFWTYTNTNNLEFKAQGSTGISLILDVYYPNAKSVSTAKINLGGSTGPECLSVRKNNADWASASVVAGSANFQNGILTIGLATGVRLTGNIYSLIVRGALSTTDEITETEEWVNGKTGAY